MINSTSLRAYTNVLSSTASTASATAKTNSNTATNVANTAAVATPAQGEKVTISDEAKAALAKSKSAYDEIANNPDPNISVKQYAIPDWLASTMEDVDSLPGHPNYNSGAISNTNKLSSADQGIRNEYSSLVLSHYQNVLKDNGVNTQEDHYNALINDKSKSEKLHQQFKDSISSDKRLSEIIQQLGIQIS